MSGCDRTHRVGAPWSRAFLPPCLAALLACVLHFACGSPDPPAGSGAAVEAIPIKDRGVPEVPAPVPVEEEVEQEQEQEEDDGHHVGALETYRYWAGEEPGEDMQVLNGEYWASAHWSKEYTLYLELRFPRAKDFVMSKRFERSVEHQVIHGAPDWFDPPADYEVWEGNLGSLYFLHPKKGHIYIFERQL